MTDRWWEQAACRGKTDLFFPELGGTGQPARDICRLCPVRQQCLDCAIDNHEIHGIWGGVTRDGRMLIARTRAKEAVLRAIRHGTMSGYQAEIRRGMTPCQACRRANADAAAQRRAQSA